jgi:hypothetical protein
MGKVSFWNRFWCDILERLENFWNFIISYKDSTKNILV